MGSLKPITIHLPVPVPAAVEKSARTQGVSRSRYIAQAVQRVLVAERKALPECGAPRR